MPWKKSFPEDQRIQFIVEATQGPGSIAELCRAFGISRKTGFKWAVGRRTAGASDLGTAQGARRAAIARPQARIARTQYRR
jgi:transposase-like protein